MEILQVIHGYPMRYNAGSEVYTQALCQSLAGKHDLHVFTREEDSFSPDFKLRTDKDFDDPRITLHLVNNPRLRDQYRVQAIDEQFDQVLEKVQPDIIHVGHLSHLSTSLIEKAAAREIPIVFTLHDYWLMCPRGQFMQTRPDDPNNLWAECSGQENEKCSKHCYSRYFSGAPDEEAIDHQYWTDWVARRMDHIRKMSELVDIFVAPSRYLHNRYREEFGIPARKLVQLDYGFSSSRMENRRRLSDEPFTFGYIGTHIPAKGIHDLIQAFAKLSGKSKLRIWGRQRGQDTDALMSMTSSLPGNIANRIEWLPEYKNQEIIKNVLNHCDAIVVPSIWVENSPLVIHEAQQARVPVITANVGGMAEYVQHEVNGLQFAHRSVDDLAKQMQRLADNPSLAKLFGEKGYLYSDNGDVVSIEKHTREIESIYQSVLNKRDTAHLEKLKGPWRITVDTNPDHCNLKCVMCEEHSPFSPLQDMRRQLKQPRRVMPFEQISKAISDAVPHGLKEIIPSTMGEPLLYEHFEKILSLCDEHKVKMNLTTNGTFPKLGATQWAKKIVPFTSDVKISWNGATKETQEAIMLGANWESMLENVRTFIAVRDEHAANGGNRCRITFQLTFLERNIDELGKIVSLAIKLGVDRVKGHHLWAHFSEIEEQSMRRNSQSIKRWNKAVIEAQEIASEQKLTNGRTILLENIFPLNEDATDDIAPGGICPFLGQEAWISAQGRFDPCCAPDAQRRTLGELGDLKEQSIMEIWNSDAYNSLVSTYRNRTLCMKCNMRKPVGGEQ